MKKNLIQTAKIIVLGFVLSIGLIYVSAWVGPPTGGIIPDNDESYLVELLDVSDEAQNKEGGLGVGAFMADSAIFNGDIFFHNDIADPNIVGPQTLCIDNNGKVVACE